MPGWNPNWSDVRFDHAAVAAAADTCRRTAGSLDMATDAHVRAFRDAAEAWTGRAADRLGDQAHHLEDRAGDLVAQLLRAADGLEAAGEQARQEQRHREAERDRWRAERDRLEAQRQTSG